MVQFDRNRFIFDCVIIMQNKKSVNSSDNSSPQPLSGDDRISFLRTSAAYKAIIGDIREDAAVKEFLKTRKETWDDYLRDVIIHTH